MRLTRQHQAFLITFLAIVILSPLTMLAPGFCLATFAQPAGRLSAILLGSTCASVDQGYMLTDTCLPVLISPACSGSQFFVLLVAMGLGLAYRHHRLTGTSAVIITIMAYALTLLTNTCRITLGLHAAIWARATLPSSMWAGAHLSVGVLVFLCALVSAYVISEWRLNHAQERK